MSVINAIDYCRGKPLPTQPGPLGAIAAELQSIAADLRAQADAIDDRRCDIARLLNEMGYDWSSVGRLLGGIDASEAQAMARRCYEFSHHTL